MDEGPGGCRVNYKQAVGEQVRGGAKTKDMRLRQKTINSHCELRRQRVRIALSREER